MPALRRRSLPPVFPRGVGTATRKLYPIKGRTGGVSGTVHERKNRGSRITDIKISLSRITKTSK